ncbi:RING finger and CHY zinc finger domain-containing protein 1-like [Penaeus monodon]|uniref:RING finger and CHY zinc finger domain-containing protein 1-like n=2 Tax=Penaeus monodon TaxID=6687 RepID=UPI0018A72B24|nr:RING finger and CHY zinc finger domain-containing protein 1-like [Penaeus monodon]
MADSETDSSSNAEENMPISDYSCTHYKRKCKLVSPCCQNNYICRFCHDDSENHTLDRANISEVECLACQKQQPLNQTCCNPDCGIKFGNYYCGLCKLFDDEDRQQYHCDGCGLCRVGGRDKFFHCDTCEMCLPISIVDTHKCIVKVSKANCPVCLEDIHTSRIVSHVPSCGHLIHRPCFHSLIKAGFYACPTCGTSMMKMNDLWKSLDEEIADTPMPKEYRDLYCYVLCRDCHKESLTLFHVLGHKCLECGSYNTVRGKGGLFRRQSPQQASGTDQAETVEEATGMDAAEDDHI